MKHLGEARTFARANGWPTLVSRAGVGLQRRLRDRLTAKRLGSPGFRAGRSPRLLGLSHIALGEDFNAGDALWLEAVLSYAGQLFAPKLAIGPHARLSDGVHIACLDRITIGAHLLCGSHVLISDHLHGRYDLSPGASDPAVPPASRSLYSPAPVVLGDNVWLGDGVAVLAGAKIGDGCVIGANAVVNSAIPSGSVAVGVPARPVRSWDAATRTWRAVPKRQSPSLID